MPPPSGRQVVLDAAGQRLVVVEVGGGLRSYRAGEVEILDGYHEGDRCRSGRGQILAPWPNRLDGGRYRFGDVSEQAPLDEPDTGNAIHGLVRWLPWQLRSARTDRAELGCRLHPQPGWAWTLDLTVGYRLGPDGLVVTLAASNRSSTACPWGAGFHPYLRAPTGRVDDLVLRVPATTRYLVDERSLPTGTAAVDDSQADFRSPAPIGERVLDVCYTDLDRGADGAAVVEVADPGSGRAVSLRLGHAWSHVMVFTGDTVGARARQGLAVEPMTGPANLLATGDHLVVLEPHGSWEGSWSLHPHWL